MSNGDDKDWPDFDKKPSKGRRDSRETSKYKKDLDKLFKSGGKVPDRFQEVMGDLAPEEGSEEAERQEAVDELREADGFRAFAKAANAFDTAGWRYPEDEDLLIRMLDHPDNEIVRKTLAHLVEISRRRDLERITPLKSRMSTIRTMTDDDRIQKLVNELEEAIS